MHFSLVMIFVQFFARKFCKIPNKLLKQAPKSEPLISKLPHRKNWKKKWIKKSPAFPKKAIAWSIPPPWVPMYLSALALMVASSRFDKWCCNTGQTLTEKFPSIEISLPCHIAARYAVYLFLFLFIAQQCRHRTLTGRSFTFWINSGTQNTTETLT